MEKEKADKGVTTRERIIAAARRMFAQTGYAGTSTEAILDDLGISRGALYHHFASKEDLFTAVLHAVEGDIAQASAQAAATGTDLVSQLGAAFNAFLDLACTTEVRQIVLTDAHSVVGWEKWRSIEEQYGLGQVKQALTLAASSGLVDPALTNVFAHTLIAALMEAAFMVAHAEQPQETLQAAKAVMQKMIQAALI